MEDTWHTRRMLNTARLDLRPLEMSDLDALHTVLGDPIAMTAYKRSFTRDESAEWIANQLRRYETDGFGLWAVELRETGAFIGDCGITLQQIENDTVVEVGYHLIRDYWHKGYATEAAAACVDWAFTNLDTDEVYAKVRETNTPSRAVAERLGMRIRRPFTVVYRGEEMPHNAFAISRAEWAER